MGRVSGKVAFITGAARGQGRSHAVRLAEEGADIIALDICAPLPTVPYPLATADDLAQTAQLVEALGRRIVTVAADVRDGAAVDDAVARGVAALGGIDIVVANAAVLNFAPVEQITQQMWDEVIGVNLTGVWHTCRAAIPVMKERGRGGSIILISSVAGLKAWENQAHYVATKHALIGLMRTMARELAPHRIRVTTVHPTSVLTDMIRNEALFRLFRPDHDDPTLADVEPMFWEQNSLPLPWVDPVDISNAILYLASDEGRYVTGITLPVDAGTLLK